MEMSKPLQIPSKAIDNVNLILKSGKLFRYDEEDLGFNYVAKLEESFAKYLNRKYAIAMNSCGSTLFVSLKSLGVRENDKVLFSGFTLAPVPSAIVHAGAVAVPVEVTKDLIINVEDLEKKIQETSPKVFIISHMRGHISDMDRVYEICEKYNVKIIEDCAHTLGAKWDDKYSGSYGETACYSFQSYKHINAGEGGVLVTDDEEVAAKSILYSGSYLLYFQHINRPPVDIIEKYVSLIPNFSLRMSNVTAALALEQIKLLDDTIEKWNELYYNIESVLEKFDNIYLPQRLKKEYYAGSSIQFYIEGFEFNQLEGFINYCKKNGLNIKWFGQEKRVGFTQTCEDWDYVSENFDIPETKQILMHLMDMRIPIDLSNDDIASLTTIIKDGLDILRDMDKKNG